MNDLNSRAPAVEMRGIVKTFGAVTANRDASLELAPGEIHALIGENGAGKSTLMRILSGMYAPDAGVVRVGGREVTGWHTAEAIAAGIGMVHQHFMLVPTLTVAENVMLGHEFTRGAQLDRRRAAREVTDLSARTGLSIDPDRLVGDLSVGEAQRVEILKAIFRGARVLILDEPTAVLTPPEVDELWGVLRGMRDEGQSVVLITHKLEEVMEVSERVTVMRRGETVERVATADTSPPALARAMVGRDVALALDARERAAPPAPTTAPERGGLTVRALTVRDSRGVTVVDSVDLDVAPSEILGIAGVEGNGQTELIEAIAGLASPASGTIRLAEREVTTLSTRQRAELGLSHIPEDRHRRGLVLAYSIADNLILGQQHRFSRRGVLDRARVLSNAENRIRAFDIRPADPALPARTLSGGNQQKIVIAREMGRSFEVLLASQPTRGVDVGAIEFIHQRLREARDEGKAILLVSADLTEVLALSDRIAVMFEGRIVALLPRAEATKEVLGAYMTGASERKVG
jgi:simple sugar transport system ATP-binding protein